jgi:hypothetical protein
MQKPLQKLVQEQRAAGAAEVAATARVEALRIHFGI